MILDFYDSGRRNERSKYTPGRSNKKFPLLRTTHNRDLPTFRQSENEIYRQRIRVTKDNTKDVSQS